MPGHQVRVGGGAPCIFTSLNLVAYRWHRLSSVGRTTHVLAYPRSANGSFRRTP
jgi:hypothetical protein